MDQVSIIGIDISKEKLFVGVVSKAVRQPRVRVHSDMCLHPEVPLIALLRLMHLRVALAGWASWWCR